MKLFLSTLLLCLFFIAPAQAQAQDDRYFNSSKIYKSSDVRTVANKKHYRYERRDYRVAKRYQRKPIRNYATNHYANYNYTPANFAQDVVNTVTSPIRAIASVIGGRPSGCPNRFCGCALARNIFGRDVRDLWLAANWRRFPSASPASGMVAWRHGHVFKLLAHVGGSTWSVWDANSGGGRIRIHNRSIAGFRIVNPTG